MKILIVGAGQVGGTLAANLSSEKNDITVIDLDGDRLRELQDRLDIGTVCGAGSNPNVLLKAGAEDADLIIAVTNSDEINMMACQLAYTIYRVPTKISRVRSTAYLNHPEIFCNEAIPIDVLISPEQLVTNNISRLLETPGALQVVDFAEGKAQLVGVKAYYGGPLVGHEIKQIRQHMPNVDTRVAAIYRKDRSIIPSGDTVVEVDDEVFFIAAREHIVPVMGEMRRMDSKYKRVIIAGGGNIGERLAQSIESRYQVKIIERNHDRCVHLSQKLSRAIVLHGHASDSDLLQAENIDSTDVFCALTNDDEANIMSSMLAKRLGATKVITLITNPAYVDLVQGGEIDIAISPQQITIGSLLTHVRRGDMATVHSLRRGAAEAIEIVAHGDHRTSKVVGRTLGEVELPEGVTIGAIVRGDDVIIAHDHIVIENNDHVILFLINKRQIKQVERLFQVGFGFF